MPTRSFTSGRIRRADYDSTSRQLELHWDDRSVTAYQQVPDEVYRRLCNAPNPATYWEDRIADEYARATPARPRATGDAAAKFNDLFGSAD